MQFVQTYYILTTRYISRYLKKYAQKLDLHSYEDINFAMFLALSQQKSKKNVSFSANLNCFALRYGLPPARFAFLPKRCRGNDDYMNKKRLQ